MNKLTYFYNGNILTMDKGSPRAPHMLVGSGRVWHCSDAQAPMGLDFRAPDFETVQRQMRGDVRFVDLNGRTVMPGFCDAHAHFMMWGEHLANADLSGAKSEEDCVKILKDHAAGLGDGEWLIGRCWSHNLWDSTALPGKNSLDAEFPNNPVFLTSKCCHLAWVNSMALQLAGVSDSTADPDGGELEKRDGRLTGILKENAMDLVSLRIGETTENQRMTAMTRAQTTAHSLGITGMQAPEDLVRWNFLQRARGQGLLTMRINFWMPVAVLDELIEAGITHGLGDDRLRISAIKVFMDGSLGGRTADMYEAYDNEPDNFGVVVTDAETITEMTLKANRAGLSMAVHAIGDRAVGNVVTAYESAAAELGRAGDTRTNPVLRNRIEHVQVYADRDFERIKALKPVASIQPIHLCADMGPADKFWGNRAKNAYACRTLADAGCMLVFGSDVPVESCNPFWGLYAATTRNNLEGAPGGGWNPQEKVSLQEALEAYTINTAVASGQQDVLGSLEPGKLADFVVLPGDPFEASAEELKDMKPVATYSGGQCVFASTQWEEHLI